MYENTNVFESHFFYRDLGEKYWSKRVNSRKLPKTVDTVIAIVRYWVYSSDVGNENNLTGGETMTITATFIGGYFFGKEVFETKVFNNSVDFHKWLDFMEDGGEVERVTKVHWDCK